VWNGVQPFGEHHLQPAVKTAGWDHFDAYDPRYDHLFYPREQDYGYGGAGFQGNSYDMALMDMLRRYQQSLEGSSVGAAPGADKAAPRTLSTENLASLGRGQGDKSLTDSPWSQAAVDLSTAFLPGQMIKSYPGMIMDPANAGFMAGAQGVITGAQAAGSKVRDAYQAAKAGNPGASTAHNVGRTTRAAWDAVKAPGSWDWRGLGKSYVKGLTDPVREAWNVGKDAVGLARGGAGTAKSLSSLMSLSSGSGASKILPGVGTALGVASNAHGAITGDQGYLTDNIWGQMAEQAARTGGDLVSALKTGPVGAAAMGLSTAANVGANAWRAGSAVADARESGRAADEAEKRLKDYQSYKQTAGTGALKYKDWRAQQKAGTPPRTPDASGSTARTPANPVATPPPAGSPPAAPQPAQKPKAPAQPAN
jgi:hypothetical protein